MIFKINSGQTVVDLRHQFADAYKGLKIEFFANAHDEGESSQVRKKVLGTEAVGDLTNVALPVEFELSGNMKASDVESLFEEKAGLHVQVFRKMRGVYIETVQTDHLSLDEHMNLSKDSTAG